NIRSPPFCKSRENRKPDSLCELTHAQAVHHTCAVNLDRAHADAKIEGDDLVRLAAHQSLENLSLARTERVDQCRSCGYIAGSVLPHAIAQRGLNRRNQCIVAVGLFNEVHSPRLHRADGSLNITLTSYHNDRQIRIDRKKVNAHLQA